MYEYIYQTISANWVLAIAVCISSKCWLGASRIDP